MTRFVKLFFTLILIGSVATISTVSSFSSSVFAEDLSKSPTAEATTDTTVDTTTDTTSDTSDTSDTTTEEPSKDPADSDTSASEWDGIIIDPVIETPAAKSTKEPKESTPVVITRVVTTVTPPASRTTTISTTSPSYSDSQSQSTTLSDSITEDPSTSLSTSDTEDISQAPTSSDDTLEITVEEPDTTIEVPATATPTFTFDDTTRKIILLALISTTIVYFLGIEIWSVKSLIRIKRNEELLKSAREKATEVKQAKITRSTQPKRNIAS